MRIVDRSQLAVTTSPRCRFSLNFNTTRFSAAGKSAGGMPPAFRMRRNSRAIPAVCSSCTRRSASWSTQLLRFFRQRVRSSGSALKAQASEQKSAQPARL